MVSLLMLPLLAHCASACTNYLITSGASADGSAMISYNADSHTMYGFLAHWPAGTHAPGSMRQVIDWETSVPLGEIPEAAETYNVVGNMNEFQLSIGETTFEGLPSLSSQPGAILDYGSLIYITLQRCKTVREAIKLMDQLTTEYGYASTGESFSLVDTKEVWVMDWIGRGPGEKGAVWVARRIPDGYVSGHANQARIRTFPLNDPENCLYSPDVVDFARKKGLYPADAPDAEFSFSDTFDPVTFESARFCEARVWAMFTKVTNSGMMEYLDYVQGRNLTNRMPLWIKPSVKIAANDTMSFMGNHFEGTWLDFRTDVGAGPYSLPYRWRPLTYKVNGSTYVNERSAGTQQSGFTMVAQVRSWLPNGIGGILWFGVDDAGNAVYAPFYCGSTSVPVEWSVTSGDMMTFSMDSAFWIFNLVSNWVYTRYADMHPELAARVAAMEQKFFDEVADVDVVAQQLAKTNMTAAVAFVTNYSIITGADTVRQWRSFFAYLFTRYMDGNVKTADPKSPLGFTVSQVGYGQPWYNRIVEDAGSKYYEPTADERSVKEGKSALMKKGKV